MADLNLRQRCSCGFDGASSPVGAELDSLWESCERVDRELQSFFAQETVRQRIAQWVKEGVEVNPKNRAYLNGEAEWPEVEDLDAFDRHMAGVEVVEQVDTSAVTDLLQDGTWQREALLEALASLLNRFGDRLRFTTNTPFEPEVQAWCTRLALTTGQPLPRGIRGTIAGLQPEHIKGVGLEKLEALGLDDAVINRVLEMLLRGELALPETGVAPLVSVVREACTPTTPSTADELAKLAAELYSHHHRLVRVDSRRWLARLDVLANNPLPVSLPSLTQALHGTGECDWWVVDCLGLPLLPALLREMAQLLPQRSLRHVRFALTSEHTTTSACYADLLDAGLGRAFEKTDVIDALVHERFLPFDDLCRIAIAELHAAARRIRPRLDQGRPLVIFADHGFRLAADGRRYEHGGPSMLERIVPLLLLDPH